MVHVMAASKDPGLIIAEAYAARATSRLSKHLRLHEAITAQIEGGRLPEGQKLPGERELCIATGLSLGTVQKALGLLVTEGRIVREHGRGTFVRAGRRPMTELWHFRFRDPAGAGLLPVYARLLGREHVAAAAPWRDALGIDVAGYVRVTRLISIADRFRCWSEMLLPFGRFGALMKLPRAELENVNLKQVLASRFRVPTLSTDQTVKLRPFSAEAAQAIGAEAGTPGLQLTITGFSRSRVPITFQHIHVPQTDCELEVGSDSVADLVELAA